MKKLIAISLVLALAVCLMLPTIGCTNTQVTTAVGKIGSYIPTVIALNSIVAGAVSALDPAIAVAVMAITATINAGLTELRTLCSAYAANPNATAWQNIKTLIDSVVTNGDAALLQAAKISNPQSKTMVTASLAALSAGLHIIDGFVSQTQTKAELQQKAANREIKLAQVVEYWNQQERDQVAKSLGTKFETAYETATALGF
jgi:hypothetical protein